MGQNNRLSFAGQDIYVGIDTGKKSWKVTIRTEHFEHKTYSQDPRPEILVKYLHKHFPAGNYNCVYEAGYFGFWIYEYLTNSGLDRYGVFHALRLFDLLHLEYNVVFYLTFNIRGWVTSTK